MIVRELITKLGFRVDGAGLEKFDKALDKIPKKIEPIQREIADTGEILNRVIGAALSIFSIRGLIRVADEMQNIRSRLSLLPQTIGDVGAAFDEVSKRASAAGVSIEGYSSLYTRLGNSAKDYISTQEDLLNITDTISKVLVVSGATAQEASSVMIQFSQGLASGALQGEEFRAMAEAAPQYLDKLSEALEIPRENLKKMASEGKLTAKTVIEATRQMSNYFDEKFRQMPLTIGRATTVITNRFTNMIDKINRESLLVTRAANFILRGFDLIETGINKIIEKSDGWGNALRPAGILISIILITKLSSLMIAIGAIAARAAISFTAFRLATLTSLLPLLKMIGLVAALVLAIEDLYVWLIGGDSVIGSFLGNWEDVKYTVIGVATAIGALAGMFLTWKLAVKSYTAALIAYQGVVIALSKVKRTLAAVAFALNLVFAATPIGVLIASIGLLIVAGVALVKNWETVKTWFSDFFSWMVDKFGGLGKWVSKLFGGGENVIKVTKKEFAAGDFNNMKMSPDQMAAGARKSNNTTVDATTNVTVTVPEGTLPQQMEFLKSAAQETFGKSQNEQLARYLSTYAS